MNEQEIIQKNMAEWQRQQAARQAKKEVGSVSKANKLKTQERLEAAEYLDDSLREVADRINEKFPDLLNSDCSIKMTGSKIKKDNEYISDLEKKFSHDSGKTIEQWKFEREASEGILNEKIITLVLNKFLGERYVVARASTYDDYRNGIDNVIIDTKTGSIVCGVDEVVDDNLGVNSTKKQEKVGKKNSEGGASLKYGAVIKNGKIEKAYLKNLPTFHIELTRDELYQALEDLKNNDEEKIKEIGSKIFAKLNRRADTLSQDIKRQILGMVNESEDLTEMEKAEMLALNTKELMAEIDDIENNSDRAVFAYEDDFEVYKELKELKNNLNKFQNVLREITEK